MVAVMEDKSYGPATLRDPVSCGACRANTVTHRKSYQSRPRRIGALTVDVRHTTLRCLNSAISSLPKPNSASTSSVCSPNSGGRTAILLDVRDSVTGWPTS